MDKMKMIPCMLNTEWCNVMVQDIPAHTQKKTDT